MFIVSHLFYVDLNESFPAAGYLLNDNFTSIALPSGVPYSDDNQLFFYDNSTLYFYDPDTYLNQTGLRGSMWTYDVASEIFTYINVSGDTNIPYAPHQGAFVSNPATGMSFYTGVQDKGLGKRDVTVPWVQVFDSSTSADVKWLTGAGGGPQFSEAQMVYIRSGKEGVLIAFGGVDVRFPHEHFRFSMIDNEVYSLPNMDNLHSRVLGIIGICLKYLSLTFLAVPGKLMVVRTSHYPYSLNRYNVTATGDIPQGRISFCAGVSSAPDSTSFQITIYAGYTLRHDSPLNDVYVLTVPAFVWINVTPPDSALGSGGNGRHEASCSMWNEAQMIVFGGIIANVDLTTGNSTAINNNGCNPAAPPLLVLNTVTYQWQSSFSPTLVYSQPRDVYLVIGGR